MHAWAIIALAIMAAMAPPATTAAPAAAVFYTPDTLRPDNSVGLLMKRAVQSMLLNIDRCLAPHDLTHAQWLPLYRLARGGCCTIAALARDQAMDPGAMTRAIDRLEAKGLLRRERSQQDRRVVQLALTDAGRDAAALVPPVLVDVLNAHLSGFSQAEWQQLIGLLTRVVANGQAWRGLAPEPGHDDAPDPARGAS
jgi:DNA-binding MarR family transcriptional regulator